MDKFLFVLANGTEGTKTLDHCPQGWDSAKTVLKRSTVSDGVTREITFDLKFLKDGRLYIQTVYEREGIEGEILVFIYEWNSNTSLHDLIYEGALDLSEYEIDETKVTAPVIQTGFTQGFVNSDEIEIDIEATESLNGRLLGIQSAPNFDLQAHSKAIKRDYDGEMLTAQDAIPALSKQFQTFLIPAYTTVNKNELDVFQLQNGFLEDSIIEVFKVKEGGDYTFSMSVQGQLTITYVQAPQSGNIEVRWYYGKNLPKEYLLNGFDHNTTTANQIGNVTIMAPQVGPNVINFGFFTTLISDTLVVNDDWSFFAVIDAPESELAGSASNRSFEFTHNVGSYLRITGITKTPEFPIKAKLVYEAFERCAQVITGKDTAFRSDFFGRTDIGYPIDGPGALSCITNGKNARGDRSPILVKWKDLFESENAKYHLGYGFEDFGGQEVVRVEPKEYFYQQNIVVDLGCVRDITMRVDSKRFFNQIKGGYNYNFNDEVNALDEFNTDRNYTTPITQVKSTLEVKSPYRSSGYEFEYQRRLKEKPTTDGRHDDENFIIRLIRDGFSYLAERNTDFTILSGIIDPDSVYNARISPLRNILNWGQTLAAALINASMSIKFTFAKANSEMVSQLSSETSSLTENQNIELSQLPDPIWRNEIYEFSAPLSNEQFAALRENPYGIVKFTDRNDIERQGYLIEVAANRNTKLADFELLRVFNLVV